MVAREFLCEQCLERGVQNQAEYLLATEEETLQGPALGDPDYWPKTPANRRVLCHQHYLLLPDAVRLDYEPFGNALP